MIKKNTKESRAIVVKRIKTDAHKVNDQHDMTRSEKKNDQLYLSKHGNEWHGKLVVFEELLGKNKELRGYRKNVCSFTADKNLKVKNAKQFATDLRKKLKER